MSGFQNLLFLYAYNRFQKTQLYPLFGIMTRVTSFVFFFFYLLSFLFILLLLNFQNFLSQTLLIPFFSHLVLPPSLFSYGYLLPFQYLLSFYFFSFFYSLPQNTDQRTQEWCQLAFEEKSQIERFLLHPYNKQDPSSATLPIECDFSQTFQQLSSNFDFLIFFKIMGFRSFIEFSLEKQNTKIGTFAFSLF